MDMLRPSPLNLIPLIVTIGVAIAVRTLVKKRQRGLRFPPGPLPLPLIGNVLDIDTKEPWKTYTEWATRYGDIFMVRVLNQDIIVISSEKIAKELLGRRSNIYSDRPHIASREPYGWSFHFAWAPYGERWRSQRRIFHQAFRPEASLAYRPVQLRKTRQLLLKFLNSPHDYYMHIQRFSASVIMSIVYDYEVTTENDPLVETLERGCALAMEGLTPEASAIVSAFPFVLNLPSWFPGAALGRKAKASRDYAVRLVEDPFKHTEKREAEGSTASAMGLDLLKRFRDDHMQLQLLKETCATTFIGSAETTSATLQCFVLAMMLNPEVQERAQAEIDAVVGKNRLPDFDDRPNLPYIEAIFMETLRMYVIAPLGVPHRNIVDDSYEDIFIPKGSTVVPNVWAMCHNDEVFPESGVFRPERFFKDGKLDEDSPINSVVFGFGRRVCPGRYSADSSIWAVMASILCAFKIAKVPDEEELDSEPSFSTGVTTRPDPFRCSITPRMLDSDIRKLSAEDI